MGKYERTAFQKQFQTSSTVLGTCELPVSPLELSTEDDVQHGVLENVPRDELTFFDANDTPTEFIDRLISQPIPSHAESLSCIPTIQLTFAALNLGMLSMCLIKQTRRYMSSTNMHHSMK